MLQYRKPAAAGLFYSGNPDELSRDVEAMLAFSTPHISPSSISGIVAPHAGYAYSGRTAAYAFNLLKDKGIKTVVIISPSHKEYFDGVSVYGGAGYETPLGKVNINREMAEKIICGNDNIFFGSQGHGAEHGVEVEIPFLQKVLKDFEIVPIVMGDQRKRHVNALATRLVESIDGNTVIIASSDLSHYYSAEIAEEKDSIVERRINDFDTTGLEKDFDMNKCEACGAGPILTLMKVSAYLNKRNGSVLHRTNSSEVTGDRSEVVGYLSSVFYA